MAEPVEFPVPKIDSRNPDLQTQIDDLRLALTDWRQNREYSKPTQERLLQITMQCARLVESWQEVERRRTGGPASLEERRPERGPADSRTGQRIQALEQAIEQEWEALPQDPDDPARRLSQQAASLAESCVTAATLALRGFANAESRLVALERDIQSGMAQMSRDLQAVLTELRAARPQSLPGAGAAFPLESVMRIHQELRDSDGEPDPDTHALESKPTRALPPAPEPTTALAARVDSLERAVENAVDAAAAPRETWRPWYVAIVLLVVLVGAALFGVWLQRRVDARLSEAELRVTAAERQRDATIASTREEAARQIAEARESAAQAQMVANVFAAPDLVRYWLTAARTDSRAYGQVLFSRSRGLVFSASRLEPAAAGQTYQLWLLTRDGPLSAGLITSDTEGRVTFATDVPLTVPGRLIGALVTLEPAGGTSAPTGERILVLVE